MLLQQSETQNLPQPHLRDWRVLEGILWPPSKYSSTKDSEDGNGSEEANGSEDSRNTHWDLLQHDLAYIGPRNNDLIDSIQGAIKDSATFIRVCPSI
jgi:hypothetical protein